jgi:uncharacterized membrane protein required for colicin V production
VNWLVLAVILLIAWKMVSGYRKGCLRVLYSLVEWLLIFVFVTWASPYVSDFITNRTQIPDYIETRCLENITNTQKEQAADLSGTDLSGAELGEKLELLGISLPDSMTEKIFDSSETQINDVLSAAGQSTEQMLEQSGVYEMIAQRITALAVDGISYIITLVAALIVFGFLGRALNLVNRIPLLGGANRVLGFVAGSLEGLLYVWIFFAVVAAGAATGWGRFITSYIAEAPVLVWLYQNNLVVNLLVLFMLK